MLRAILTIACSFVLIAFILNGCAGKEIVVEYKYVECKVPELPAKPKYLRVQWQLDSDGMIEFKSNEDAKGLLLNDLMNRSQLEELRTILENMREKK